jgi:hypothetical protein
MTTQAIIAESVAEGAGISQEVAIRIVRGVAHYSHWHQEIQVQHNGIYWIPASSGSGYFYRVILKETGEVCNCADKKGHSLGLCKHTICALIADAKRPTYRIRKTQGDLFELLETRAGIERVIEWGTLAEVYHEKWALENPEWEDIA